MLTECFFLGLVSFLLTHFTQKSERGEEGGVTEVEADPKANEKRSYSHWFTSQVHAIASIELGKNRELRLSLGLQVGGRSSPH